MKLRRLLGGITVAALLFLPAGLSAQQPTTLRIAFNGFGGITPLYVAQDAGIFKKRGIALEMIFIPGGSLSLQALIGNSKTHKEEGIKKVMALSGLDRPTAERVYAGSLPAVPDDGRPTLKGLEVVLEAAAKEDPKAKSLTVQQLLDLRFLP
jgi:hypothetical protein